MVDVWCSSSFSITTRWVRPGLLTLELSSLLSSLRHCQTGLRVSWDGHLSSCCSLQTPHRSRSCGKFRSLATCSSGQNHATLSVTNQWQNHAALSVTNQWQNHAALSVTNQWQNHAALSVTGAAPITNSISFTFHRHASRMKHSSKPI